MIVTKSSTSIDVPFALRPAVMRKPCKWWRLWKGPEKMA